MNQFCRPPKYHRLTKTWSQKYDQKTKNNKFKSNYIETNNILMTKFKFPSPLSSVNNKDESLTFRRSKNNCDWQLTDVQHSISFAQLCRVGGQRRGGCLAKIVLRTSKLVLCRPCPPFDTAGLDRRPMMWIPSVTWNHDP